MTDSQMIYVHIPFCVKRCNYCAFVSCVDFDLVEKYFKALQKEIMSRKNSNPISSIYFGGGTPSCVDEHFICDLLKLIKKEYNILPTCEISIECNPNTTTLDKLKAYFDVGFNRISFGVQSLNESELLKLGRVQTSNQVKNAILMAKQVGFKNISADLLLGIENQNLQEVEKQIETLYVWGITHFSLYMLMVEEGTKLFDMVKNCSYTPTDDDLCVEIYEGAKNKLQNLGFKRYEVSNFAKRGFCCKHNIGYWQMKPYLGFGLSAHSFLDNKRIANPNTFEKYFNGEKETEVCTENSLKEERIMLGLRTVFGVDEKYISNKDELNLLLQSGVLEKNNSCVRVAESYYGILNQIILKLI